MKLRTLIKNILLKIHPVFRVSYHNLKLLETLKGELNCIREQNEQLMSINNLQLLDARAKEQQLYEHWLINNVRNAPLYAEWPHLSTTFQYNSHYGKLVYEGMLNAELLFEKELLLEIKEKNIEGALVEFGVSKGVRLKHLIDSCKDIHLDRYIYGFDSFEGLPKPDYAYDMEFWKEGWFDANIHDVKKYLNCNENKNVKLIKGLFADTFKQDEAQNLKQIAFARIDCDLYHPAVECLDYLKDRLVDNSILVFDDWMNNLRYGETKAFYEWLPTCGYHFDFLLLNSGMHLYLRAKRQ